MREPSLHLCLNTRENALLPQTQWTPIRYFCDLLAIERQGGCTELANNECLVLSPKVILGEILQSHAGYLAEGNSVGQQPFTHLLLLRSARQGERYEGERSISLHMQAVCKCAEILEELEVSI